MPVDFNLPLWKPQILHLFTIAIPRKMNLIQETLNKVRIVIMATSELSNNGILWCMGLLNKIPIYPQVIFYCRDCNKRSLSEVKNLMVRLSSGSILLDTCLFMANLKSSFTPLSAPRVEIRRWLQKIAVDRTSMSERELQVTRWHRRYLPPQFSRSVIAYEANIC
jgi:hypothetical protein